MATQYSVVVTGSTEETPDGVKLENIRMNFRNRDICITFKLTVLSGFEALHPAGGKGRKKPSSLLQVMLKKPQCWVFETFTLDLNEENEEEEDITTAVEIEAKKLELSADREPYSFEFVVKKRNSSAKGKISFWVTQANQAMLARAVLPLKRTPCLVRLAGLVGSAKSATFELDKDGQSSATVKNSHYNCHDKVVFEDTLGVEFKSDTPEDQVFSKLQQFLSLLSERGYPRGYQLDQDHNYIERAIKCIEGLNGPTHAEADLVIFFCNYKLWGKYLGIKAIRSGFHDRGTLDVLNKQVIKDVKVPVVCIATQADLGWEDLKDEAGTGGVPNLTEAEIQDLAPSKHKDRHYHRILKKDHPLVTAIKSGLIASGMEHVFVSDMQKPPDRNLLREERTCAFIDILDKAVQDIIEFNKVRTDAKRRSLDGVKVMATLTKQREELYLEKQTTEQSWPDWKRALIPVAEGFGMSVDEFLKENPPGKWDVNLNIEFGLPKDYQPNEDWCPIAAASSFHDDDPDNDPEGEKEESEKESDIEEKQVSNKRTRGSSNSSTDKSLQGRRKSLRGAK